MDLTSNGLVSFLGEHFGDHTWYIICGTCGYAGHGCAASSYQAWPVGPPICTIDDTLAINFDHLGNHSGWPQPCGRTTEVLVSFVGKVAGWFMITESGLHVCNSCWLMGFYWFSLCVRARVTGPFFKYQTCPFWCLGTSIHKFCWLTGVIASAKIQSIVQPWS